MAYEHAILRQLEQADFGSFEVPRLLSTRADATATSVPISCMEPGTRACMFHVIGGGAPDVRSPVTARSAGEATARLVRVLERVSVSDVPCPNPRFRDVYAACPGRTLEHAHVAAVMNGPEFEQDRMDAAYLLTELQRVHALASQQPLLPAQQIHADAHLDNFLTRDGHVTAVLDFEFSAHDWRVMEAAVGLTKYVATSGIDVRAMVAAYLEGYASAGGVFTEAECEFLPDGMVLRIVSNVVFFVGRATSTPPQDNIATLTSKVASYAKRCRWVEDNRTWLVQLAKGLLVTGKQ